MDMQDLSSIQIHPKEVKDIESRNSRNIVYEAPILSNELSVSFSDISYDVSTIADESSTANSKNYHQR